MADLERWIGEKGLKSIINLRGRKEDERWFISERELAAKHGIALHNFRLSPHELPGYLDLISMLEILATAERPLLIHCRHGVDRTGLVSALALAVEKDPPLRELKDQFSWKYGVLPFYVSTGPYFFSLYEKWLERTGSAHSLANLHSWIRNDYVDGQGNTEYSIGSINGKIFEGQSLHIHDTAGTIAIEGWAFDSKEMVPPQGMLVTIDDHVTQEAAFTADRPDVADYFGIAPSVTPFIAGWKAEFRTGDLHRVSSGCHTISLTVLREKQVPFKIQTGRFFCLVSQP
jgi:protein tyrosine phosphatase (PTP) superfamily phosphohydrolase (DUF442 family)